MLLQCDKQMVTYLKYAQSECERRKKELASKHMLYTIQKGKNTLLEFQNEKMRFVC